MRRCVVRKIYPYLVFAPLILLSACSGKEDQSTPETANQPGDEHFLKDKTQAIDKARQVEQLLNSEAGKQRQAIEKQSQ